MADDAGLERFALMAMAQGGPPSIHYATRHPERLTRLVFYISTAACVPDPTPGDLELEEVVQQMIRVGYGREDSTFRRVFTSLMIPDGTEEADEVAGRLDPARLHRRDSPTRSARRPR